MWCLSFKVEYKIMIMKFNECIFKFDKNIVQESTHWVENLEFDLYSTIFNVSVI